MSHWNGRMVVLWDFLWGRALWGDVKDIWGSKQ